MGQIDGKITGANTGFASGGGFCKLQAHFFSGINLCWRLPLSAVKLIKFVQGDSEVLSIPPERKAPKRCA